jgi:hypothetical protein
MLLQVHESAKPMTLREGVAKMAAEGASSRGHPRSALLPPLPPQLADRLQPCLRLTALAPSHAQSLRWPGQEGGC